MATSAYESWLKKREFKVPRASASPPAKICEDLGVSASTEVSASDKPLPQHKRQLVKAYTGKFHTVSGVETTQVAVKSVAQPAVVGQRGLSNRDEGGEETKVAGSVKVAETKVAGRKRQRIGQDEERKATTLKLVSAFEVIRQSSVKRKKERAVWSGKVDTDAKVAGKVALTVEARSKVLTKEKVSRKRTLQESESGDNTTKRLRFQQDKEESESCGVNGGLPPKSPMKKKRRMRTAMLDESQYWMAVDRFSHLT